MPAMRLPSGEALPRRGRTGRPVVPQRADTFVCGELMALPEQEDGAGSIPAEGTRDEERFDSARIGTDILMFGVTASTRSVHGFVAQMVSAPR